MFEQPINKRLNGVIFGFYTSEEIRKLSVKEISNPVAFDQLNRPLVGGLYDPIMGVSPYDKFTKCETCGQEGINCTGHLAHVELLLPVYNPFLMDRLIKLLKYKCFSCHKLRIPQKKIDDFCNMLILLKLGYITECHEFEKTIENKYLKEHQKSQNNDIMNDLLNETTATDTTRSRANSGSSKAKESKSQTNAINFINKTVEVQKAQEKIDQILDLINVKKNKSYFDRGINTDDAINTALRNMIQNIWNSVQAQKCPHCNALQNTVRKEGYSKFFIFKQTEEQAQMDSDSDKDSISKSFFNESYVESEKTTETSNSKNKKQHFLNPIQIREHMRMLWKRESKLLKLIFGNIIINAETLERSKTGYHLISNDYQMFFVDVIPVTPNRFRPENKMGEQTFLHGHTVILSKIIQLNQELKLKLCESEEANLSLKKRASYLQSNKLTSIITQWLEIQDAVNCFYDSSKALKNADKEANSGIKQLLEKKEGLFRMKMMGKRVNYAARSVISPDPNLDTNEVGVPIFMAKKLTFPESVNEINAKRLRQIIINGPSIHPGANAIEENGVRINLETRTEQQRIAIANTLLTNLDKKVVYRHLQTGDVLLFNRQPTLHKPSIMSHIARVLPKEQTIRMHYANCNSYNADFDGDEMNLHFLQTHQARAEGYHLSLTDKQYIVAKNGEPIRGLIQDSIFSAVFLTMKDTFLTKAEFDQLIFIGTWNLLGNKRLNIVEPAIQKPKRLWTGKQVITQILNIIVQYDHEEKIEGFNMVNKTRLGADSLGPFGKEETQIIIQKNELLQGIVDKNSVGNVNGGLIHCFYELYDSKATGKLLSTLSRTFMAYIQMRGFTCGIEDLYLDDAANQYRREQIDIAHINGVKSVAQFVGMNNYQVEESLQLCNRPSYKVKNGQYKSNIIKRQPEIDYISTQNPILPLLMKKMLDDDNTAADLDMNVKGVLSQETTNIIKIAKTGLLKKFPDNFFSSMVLSGAKGSMVNHNQVSVMLGQQELEGRRVPIMPSGRTLPSFLPYDPNPRAGGYITDRFLTGLRPQDFFFHCMAGREGLIDTAVKTSRSGYLQRCLVKHLECLNVNYDCTVRESDGSIVQFHYGEDSIDPTKSSFLSNYNFLATNYDRYMQKYNVKELASKIGNNDVKNFLKERIKDPQLKETETILNRFFPGQHLGAISENQFKAISQFILDEKAKGQNGIFQINDFSEKKFYQLFNTKYFYSLVHPGEAVGPIAAQSIGEPSTQMTLNTFHLAGHGGANVTLGIPRLREILMTATDKIKTPSMMLSFANQNLSREEAENYQRKLQKVNMKELVSNIEVHEEKEIHVKQKLLSFSERSRVYKVFITFEDLNAIEFAFELNELQLKEKISKLLIPNIDNVMQKQLKKNQMDAKNIIQQQSSENHGKILYFF